MKNRIGVCIKFIHAMKYSLQHVEAKNRFNRFLLPSMRNNLADSISYFELPFVVLCGCDAISTTASFLANVATALGMLLVITPPDAALVVIDP